MTFHKEPVDQARANLLKIVRTAIRLKHALAADAELNEVLPKAEEEFNRRVHDNELPSPPDIKKVLGL